ncbi:hypothetical protein GGR58DRAFT_527567 [Xylaria digitata]|nr:hypothetical protein GGR58DRAFT_527567 [Xylaria digitata]
MINPLEQDSGHNSSKPGKEPSKRPLVEEADDNRDNPQHFICSGISDQAPERRSPLPAPGPHPDQDINHSLLVFGSIYGSVIGILNMESEPNAWVQNVFDLIKLLPRVQPMWTENFIVDLTTEQYEKLLRTIEESEDRDFQDGFKAKLWPTIMHEEVGDGIMKKISLWRQSLQSSTNSRVAGAARIIVSSGSAIVKFPFAEGVPDQKPPDRSLGHACQLLYCMDGMYDAEVENEYRLYNMHLAGEVNEDGSYAKDERNETGEASIRVWRATVGRNGAVVAQLVQDEDFLCECITDCSEFEESLEISSEDLCKIVNESLEHYGWRRGGIQKNAAEEKRKQQQEATHHQSSEGGGQPGAADSRSSNDEEILDYISEQLKRQRI